MGVASDLGYQHRRPNRVQAVLQSVASSKAGAWVFSKTIRHLDDAVTRLTRGKHSVPEVLAGLPVLDLITTGRRSGQPRTTHLVAIPIGQDLALLGTNFGQAKTPAWVFNLEADPSATVRYRDAIVPVRARPATEDERAEVMSRSAGIYGGYEKYQQRITGREVRIFLLESVD